MLWEWQYSVQREEQARQGCLSVCAQVLCKDAKPTKHTQTLILRKARGIVRFLEGLVRGEGWCGNPSGSRPNFFGDSTSPLTRGGKNVVRSEGGLAIPPVVARIFSGDSTSPLTREARVLAIFKGLLSFCNCCGNGSIRCNGRSKQGKDALACVPKCFARMQSQPSTHRHSSYEKWVG